MSWPPVSGHMCPKESCAKLEFVGQLFLVGAGDFSPPNGYVFGTEVNYEFEI